MDCLAEMADKLDFTHSAKTQLYTLTHTHTHTLTHTPTHTHTHSHTPRKNTYTHRNFLHRNNYTELHTSYENVHFFAFKTKVDRKKSGSGIR